MSHYVRVTSDELIATKVVIRGMAWWLIDGYETFYVDARRLRREIRRAQWPASIMSDMTPFAWRALAKKHGVRCFAHQIKDRHET